MKFLSILSALSFASATTLLRQENHIDIVGGQEAAKGKHLYVVGLRDTPTSGARCGGSLIAPRVVLTAAHCIGSWAKYVSIGSHYLSGSSDGEVIKIVKQIRHPKNNANTNSYDVAIILLEKDSSYTPVDILWDDNSSEVQPGQLSWVRGWGTTSEGGSQSNVLKEVDIKIWSNSDCAKQLNPIDDSMICAGGLAGEDSCQGDSGGPLTVENNGKEKVIGVVSWGEGCGRANKPGVYGRVSVARDFISQYLPSGPSPTPSSPGPITPTPAPTSTWTPSTTTPAPSTVSPDKCQGCTRCFYPDLNVCLGASYSQDICNYFNPALGTIWCGSN